MTMTMAETILARASGRDRVVPGEYLTASIDKFVAHEAFAAVYLNLDACRVDQLNDPDRLVVILDHYVPAPTVRAATIHQLVRAGVERYGVRNYYGLNEGIAHQVVLEKGHISPGELVLGTDSHTCTYGGVGAAASGVGFSEFTYALATGKLWFMVPQTIRFIISGTPGSQVTAKDIILKIAGDHSAEVAQYQSVEFCGPAADEMSVDSRLTMSNMAVEIGAKFGFFHPDQKALDFLSQSGEKPAESLSFDPGAPAAATHEVDINGMIPQVAAPHSVDNVKPVTEFKDVIVQQAVLGSCTNGRNEDLKLAADLISGKKVHPKTRLLVIPASAAVYRQALDDGSIKSLAEAGAIILNAGCGPCFGGHMGILGNGENCISSTNRNFKGRMGGENSGIYLASPATVVASAINGRITNPQNI